MLTSISNIKSFIKSFKNKACRKCLISIAMGGLIIIPMFFLGKYQQASDRRIIDSLNTQSKIQRSMLINYGNVLYTAWKVGLPKLDLTKIKVIHQDKETSLDNVVREQTIFVRLAPTNCWSCAQFISNYIKKRQRSKVKFLIEGMDTEVLNAFLINIYQHKKDVYISSDDLPIPIDAQREPYLFKITPAGNITKTLKPIKEDTLLLDLFFSED